MTLVLVALICFAATLVRSTFGFGESLVAVPLLAMVIPIDVAVPVCELISIQVALIAVVQDWASIHFASAKWLVAFSIPGIPIGMALLVYVDSYWIRIILGILIILYSAYAALNRAVAHLEDDHKGWLFVCGFLSGVLGGAYGINGPPLIVYGKLRRWSPQHFRATLQAYFLPASIAILGGFALKGLVTTTVMTDFALCLPATVPAVFLGRYLNSKLGGPAFFKYVYGGLIAIGTSLIVVTAAGRA
jgi:uncharacterized membrane protein YfcA